MSKKALLVPKEPRLTTPANKQLGIDSWDVDNNYPARMRGIVADSVTAQNCLRVFRRFVMGRGLADSTLATAIVNTDGETGDKVVRKAIDDKGFIGAMAFHINYNAAFQKTEIRALRIDDVRLATDKEKVAIHPNWAKRKDKKTFKPSDIEYYDVFNDSPEAIIEQVEAAGGWENYKGQVFYWSPWGLEYTVAPWDAAAEDMQTEGGIKTFRNRIVGQNFMPSQIIVVDDLESDDEDTAGDGVDEQGHSDNVSFAETIVGMVREYQGSEEAGSVMVIQKPSPETTFELKTPDLQHFDGMYDSTDKGKDSAILRGFMMPRPLILEAGDSIFPPDTAILASSNYYNTITEDDRHEVAEVLSIIFSNFEVDVCPSGDYSLLPLVFKKAIDPAYFPYFTKNEIRESLGAPQAEESDADKKMLVESIGVGGTQSLVSILTDQVLTTAQKKGALKLLFNFTDEEVSALLGANNDANVNAVN